MVFRTPLPRAPVELPLSQRISRVSFLDQPVTAALRSNPAYSPAPGLERDPPRPRLGLRRSFDTVSSLFSPFSFLSYIRVGVLRSPW